MTKEKFAAYVKVQKSGRTNMFHVTYVCKLSRGVLTHDDCFDIMKNYAAYASQWPDVIAKAGRV